MTIIDPAAAGERAPDSELIDVSKLVNAYYAEDGIDGPLFLGWDTHALMGPAVHADRLCNRQDGATR